MQRLAVMPGCHHQVTQCEHQEADYSDVDCPLNGHFGQGGVPVVGVIVSTGGIVRPGDLIFFMVL